MVGLDDLLALRNIDRVKVKQLFHPNFKYFKSLKQKFSIQASSLMNSGDSRDELSVVDLAITVKSVYLSDVVGIAWAVHQIGAPAQLIY